MVLHDWGRGLGGLAKSGCPLSLVIVIKVPEKINLPRCITVEDKRIDVLPVPFQSLSLLLHLRLFEIDESKP